MQAKGPKGLTLDYSAKVVLSPFGPFSSYALTLFLSFFVLFSFLQKNRLQKYLTSMYVC